MACTCVRFFMKEREHSTSWALRECSRVEQNHWWDGIDRGTESLVQQGQCEDGAIGGMEVVLG